MAWRRVAPGCGSGRCNLPSCGGRFKRTVRSLCLQQRTLRSAQLRVLQLAPAPSGARCLAASPAVRVGRASCSALIAGAAVRPASSSGDLLRSHSLRRRRCGMRLQDVLCGCKPRFAVEGRCACARCNGRRLWQPSLAINVFRYKKSYITVIHYSVFCHNRHPLHQAAHAASAALSGLAGGASTALGCRASRGLHRPRWAVGLRGLHRLRRAVGPRGGVGRGGPSGLPVAIGRPGRFARPGCCSPSAATASSSRRTLSAPGAPNTVPICRFWAGGFSHAGRKRHNGTRKSCRLESGIRMARLQCDALLARCAGARLSRQPSATKTPAAQRSRCPTQPRPDATDALAAQRSRCAARPT